MMETSSGVVVKQHNVLISDPAFPIFVRDESQSAQKHVSHSAGPNMKEYIEVFGVRVSGNMTGNDDTSMKTSINGDYRHHNIQRSQVK